MENRIGFSNNKLISSSIEAYKIIRAYEAWDLYDQLKTCRKTGSNIVGVLDTMFYDKHRDLEGVLESDTSFLCESSHGTHVAGIIGARENYQTKGIFPDASIIGKSIYAKAFLPIYGVSLRNKVFSKIPLISNVSLHTKLWSLLKRDKIVINCSFGYNDIVQSFLYANTSLFYHRLVSERRKRNNILLGALRRGNDFLIVQSSGNFSKHKKFNGDYLDSYYSAHFASNHPDLRDRIITVGAMKDGDNIWTNSQLGDMVDLLAPGYRIRSTISEEETIKQNLKGLYGTLTGTSMAAPFVSGAAAMLWYLFPDLSGPDIKNILIRSGNDIYNKDDQKTYKVLDLYRALRYASVFG